MIVFPRYENLLPLGTLGVVDLSEEVLILRVLVLGPVEVEGKDGPVADEEDGKEAEGIDSEPLGGSLVWVERGGGEGRRI